MAVEQYLPLIRKAAQRYGLDWTTLAALVEFESGGNPNARNKSSGATGLGQVMPREAGFAGRPSIEELLDPETNLDWSAKILSEGLKRWGTEEQALAAYLGAIDGKGNITRAKDANGTDGPKYVSEVRKRQGKYTGQKGGSAGTPIRARLWPFEGYDPSTTRITTKFGDPQTITPGYEKVFAGKPKTADGRPMNTGVDYAVKAGTRIRAPEDAEVSAVTSVEGKHGGYGNSVELKFADGTKIRFGHLQDVPTVKVGQKLQQGQVFGQTGATGNATGAHTDGEARDASGKYIDSLRWFTGTSEGSGNVALFAGSAGGVKAWAHQGRTLQQYTPPEITIGEPAPLGWTAEELLAEAGDIRYAQVPAPRTLNSRKGPMTSSTINSRLTTGMPDVAITGPDGATMQAVFNMMLTIAQQAYANLGQQGKSPQMIWDPEAFDDGQGNPIGGFVPTGGMVDTLAAVNQAVTNNRAQITALAAVAGQSGRVPVIEMGEDGYLYQLFDDAGRPVYQESQDSRNARLQAGNSVGYVSKDLLSPQAAPQGTMRRIAGPQTQQPSGPNVAPPPQTEQQATDRFMPGAGDAPQVNSQGGSTVNPATGGTPHQGQPIYSSNETGLQYPSGQGQGSAYSLNPAPMHAPNAASDGQTFGSQSREVQQTFVAQYGPQEAERRWIEEHNQAIGGGGALPSGYNSGGGGSLQEQSGRGVVRSEDEDDSLQERVRRRIETGVVPVDMLTVAGDGEGESIVNAPTPTIGDAAARASSDPAVQAALRNQQAGQTGAVASPQNVRAQTQSANRQAAGESTPRARGAAVNEAGTTGVPLGQGLIQHPGTPGRTITIRPEYMQHLGNTRIAPGYIEGSGTYNQFPLDQPGLFGPVPNSGSSNVVNLRYGLGGTGDPTTGLETQTPEEWVQGAPLFEWQHPGQRPGDYGYDHLVTLFMRSDTPSGMGTPTWSAPDEYWQSMYNAIREGHVKPTQRGWQMLAQRGVTPQSLGMQA